jgi:hypothetical protein
VIDHDMIACWKVNYGLDTRTPADAMRYWDERCNGMAPAGAVAALGLCIEHIERLRAELAEARRGAEAVNGESHADRCTQFAVDADADTTSYGINRNPNAWWRSTVSSACTLEAQLAEAQRERDLLREFMRDVCADLKCEQNDEAALLAIQELREEVAALAAKDAEIVNLIGVAESFYNRMTAAEQEAAALRADAERYRWLRSCVDVPALYVKNHPGKPRSLLAFQALDATIDIARGET